MNKLEKGEFFGTHYQKTVFENIIITDTEYTHRQVDWHYHDNPYFTFLLQGKLFEANKKESHYLEAGNLLFHNWQDAHYNIKPADFTRGFHIEMNQDWFLKYELDLADFEGSVHLKNPLIKNSVNKIFIESKIQDEFSNLSIESSLLEIFTVIQGTDQNSGKNPIWVRKLQEILHEEGTDYSLKSLSLTLDIHPIHLSREFSRYFGTSLGNYLRLVKLNKAFHLLATKQFSMTEVCYQCGFYDQSHFISSFKRIYNSTPTKLLKIISSC